MSATGWYVVFVLTCVCLGLLLAHFDGKHT